MSNRPQSGSRRGSGQRYQKSTHDKAKPKAKKQPAGVKYAPEDISTPSLEETVEKTLSSLNNLGNQKFALFPFSQYFDDWLINVRSVLSGFESNQAVNIDEQFVKERSQIFVDIEREFAERRIKETSLQDSAKALSDTEHLLVQLDNDYAIQTRTLSQKRDGDIEHLAKNVHDLEEELIIAQQMKTSFFNPMSKRIKTQKVAEVTQKLNTAKAELDLAVQNFRVEQEKLHDDYVNKKQAATEKAQSLEKEVATIETDTSAEGRKNTCDALANAVKAFVQRNQAPPPQPQPQP